MGIKIDHVTFSYGENKVLNDINLTIKTGDRIGIVGASGCGKSTFLKLISGLYAPQNGYLEIEGAATPTEIRKYVAIVMQNALLFPASILENITCGHIISNTIIKEACEAAQLSDWISTLPDGLQTFVGERGCKVSGGQAQRIAIARAIAKQAPIVLLDEATSALDVETGNAMLLALKNLTNRKTVVSVTHCIETIIDCTCVYRLEEGRFYDA
ncbi:MAG: ATP-binding cassette domain-containing protein [Saccharofermentanales bacterium]